MDRASVDHIDRRRWGHHLCDEKNTRFPKSEEEKDCGKRGNER